MKPTESEHETVAHGGGDALYYRIFGALALFTLLTYGLSFLPLPHAARFTGSMVISIAKAALVALFFMHLRFEKRFLAYIFLFPFVLAIIFSVMILPDIGIRAVGP